MSKKKVIHVDQLIVKANEVIILDENKRRYRRDPWLGFVPENRDDENDRVEDVLEESFEKKDEEFEGDDRRGFRWF